MSKLTFNIDKKQVTERECFTITWDCPNPDMVSLSIEDGVKSLHQLSDSGSRSFPASGNADKITLTLRASIGGKVEEKKAYVKVKRKVLKAEKVHGSAKSSKSWQNPIDFSKMKPWWNGLISKFKLAWTYMPENKKLAYKILGLIMVSMVLTSISPKLASVGFLLVVGYLFWVIFKK